MNTTQIRLISNSREGLREAAWTLEGLVNGQVDADGLTQQVEFNVPSPGRRGEWLAYGHITTGLRAGVTSRALGTDMTKSEIKGETSGEHDTE